MADQVDRAPAVFKRAAGFANDLGLLAEEVDGSLERDPLLVGEVVLDPSHAAFASAHRLLSPASVDKTRRVNSGATEGRVRLE
jgi:hypothetical protein